LTGQHHGLPEIRTFTFILSQDFKVEMKSSLDFYQAFKNKYSNLKRNNVLSCGAINAHTIRWHFKKKLEDEFSDTLPEEWDIKNLIQVNTDAQLDIGLHNIEKPFYQDFAPAEGYYRCSASSINGSHVAISGTVHLVATGSVL